MMTFSEALVRFSVQEGELRLWIEQQWVRPAQEDGDWRFDDSDEARLALICELRGEMAVNDEAIPLVLSLLDQLYAARNALRHVRDAIMDLPDPALQGLLARISEELDKA